MKQQFEAFIKSNTLHVENLLAKNSDGSYKIPDIQAMWLCFVEGCKSRWRPIETAPKDGTAMRIYTSHLVCLDSHFSDGHWRDHYGNGIDGKATHWMPLPPPPQ